ncbi:hypothetical protein [Ruminococcus sp. NK3A76]|uniref:hypothetical protein n=1 Tax=Ruminococcus sp. NK3A76 TaxID=877411 RepID=UPI0012EC96B9|nr:hypothetical protein [Ruminococcus sp. NK3A76]
MEHKLNGNGTSSYDEMGKAENMERLEDEMESVIGEITSFTLFYPIVHSGQ